MENSRDALGFDVADAEAGDVGLWTLGDAVMGTYPIPDRTHPPADRPTPQAWADAVVAFIGTQFSGQATLEDLRTAKALVDTMPGDGLPGVWRDVGDLLGTWVRRREDLTRVIGFHLPLATLDRALADMPQARQAWQDRKDLTA